LPSFLFSSTFRKRHPVIPSSSFLPTPFSIFYESSTTPFISISLKRFFFTTKDNFARNLGTKLFSSSFLNFFFVRKKKMNKLSVFSLFFITWLSDPCVTQVCLFLPKKESLIFTLDNAAAGGSNQSMLSRVYHDKMMNSANQTCTQEDR
jgi:hypothetical protein